MQGFKRYSPSFKQRQFHIPFVSEPNYKEQKELYYGKNSPGFSQRLLRESRNFQPNKPEKNLFLDKSAKGTTVEITFQNPTQIISPKGYDYSPQSQGRKAPQLFQKKRCNFRINYESKDESIQRSRLQSPQIFQELQFSQNISRMMLLSESFQKPPSITIANKLLFNQIQKRQSQVKADRKLLKTTEDDYREKDQQLTTGRDQKFSTQQTEHPYLLFERKSFYEKKLFFDKKSSSTQRETYLTEKTQTERSELMVKKERIIRTGRTNTTHQDKKQVKEKSHPHIDLRGWELEDLDDDIYIKI